MFVRTQIASSIAHSIQTCLRKFHQSEGRASSWAGSRNAPPQGRSRPRLLLSGDEMTSMSTRIRQLMAGAALVCAGAAQAAAQDQTAATGSTDVIIVTATRTETPVERLPVQVDLIDRAEIELNAIATLADALQFSPGVNAVQSGPAGSITSVFTRGSNSKHTLALFDGIRLNDASAPNGQFNFGQDLLGDAERVEVVRGPLSSVYGSDAIGGVVNIVPRIGGESGFDPYFEVAAGEFSTVRGLAGAAGTIDKLSYNLTVEVFETDGYDEVPERFEGRTGDPDGASFLSLTALGSYDLGRGFALEALYRARRADSEFDTFSGGPNFGRADDPDVGVAQDDYDVWRIGGVWDSPARNLESRLRLGQVLNEREGTDNGARTDTAEGERTFAEWLNVWTPSDRGGLRDPVVSFGVQYQNEDISTTSSFSNPLDEAESSWGAYALATVGLGARFELSASGRVDDYEEFGSASTWNIGGVYDLAELGLQITGSYGTSFKAPTLSERFSNSSFVTANPDLDPEDGTNWEIGLRGALDWFDRAESVRYGGVWFDGEIENLIESQFDPETFTFVNRNVGVAEIEGYELFVELEPHDAVTARVDYTFTDAVNGTTGARLLRRPAHVYTASVTWRPAERAAISLRYLYNGQRTDVNYADSGAFLGVGGVIGEYEVFNLSATLDLNDDLQIFGSVNNLFDENYEQPEAFAGAPQAVTVGIRGRF